jgi:hypothetical protein
MAQEPQQSRSQVLSIEVPREKALYLTELSTLSAEALEILAKKSKKPGIEQKLKAYQNWF